MSLGDRLVARTAAIIARQGVSVSITHGGAATSRPGLVSIMTGGDRTTAFRTYEIVDWLAPAFLVTIAGNGAPVSVGDLVVLPADYAAPGDLHVMRIEHTDSGAVCLKTTLFCAAVVSGSGSTTSGFGSGNPPQW